MIFRRCVLFLSCFLVISVTTLHANPAAQSDLNRSAQEIAGASRVKKISIDGAFPIFKNDVRNVMTLAVGDVFGQSKLEEQAARIVDLFKREGYIDPQISVRSQKDPEDGHHTLFVEIVKGPFLKIADVQMNGNKNISSIRLLLKAKVWKSYSFLFGGQRFVRKELENDKKQLIQLYREKGFADAQIVHRVEKDFQQNRVIIIFDIVEGPLYKFEFQGNTAVRSYALKKQVVVFKEGNSHGFGIRKSIRNMRKIYTEHGYPDVVISSETKDSIDEEYPIRQVGFIFEEGPRYLVDTLVFNGNHAIDANQITSQMITGNPAIGSARVYVKKTLEEDLDAIRTLYLEQGYARAQVDKKVEFSAAPASEEKKQTHVKVEITIDEGPRTLIGSVSFDGLVGLEGADALEKVSLKPGTIFRHYMVQSDENILKTIASEKGYPHVQVQTQVSVSRDGTTADLVFQMTPGPPVNVNRILYAGNFRTLPSVLDDEMVVKPSEPLVLTELLKSRQNIQNMDAIDSARFRTLGLKEESPAVDIVVEVKEKKPYYVELETGYDTRRHIYAQTALGDHNFLGRNLNLESALEVSQVGYNGYVSLKEPNFFKLGVLSTTRIYVEKKEEFNKTFGTKTFGFSQEAFKSFFEKKLTVSSGVSYRAHRQYATYESSQPQEDDPEIYERRDILVFSKDVTFRTTDSYVRPTKGTFSTASLDISNGIDNDLDDFIKYQLDSRWYTTPVARLTMAVHGRYGLVQPYGDNTTIPDDQLFFLGGTSTVRGFDENLLRYDADHKAVGGKQVLHGSLEARLDLSRNFEFALFYDIGSVSQASDLSGSDDFRSSVGCGIRYMTPIGPIGLLYGYKLDPRPGESAGAFHFSMGYTF